MRYPRQGRSVAAGRKGDERESRRSPAGSRPRHRRRRLGGDPRRRSAGRAFQGRGRPAGEEGGGGLRHGRASAPTTAGRSPRACSTANACAAPGTTPASGRKPGEAVHAPAIDPVAIYAVERRGERVFVTGTAKADRASQARSVGAPRRWSSSAAGPPASPPPKCCAGRATGAGHPGVGRRRSRPYDRPNLSKDYLAGNAPEEWMPLRSPDWYRERADRAASSDTGSLALDAGGAPGRARRRPPARLRRAAARHRRHAGAPDAARAPSPPHVHTLRSHGRQPGDRRRRRAGEKRGGRRRELHRPRGRRRRSPLAALKCTSWRRRRCRWHACWDRSSAPSCAPCTRSTASASTSARPSPAIGDERGHADGRRPAGRRPGGHRRRRAAEPRSSPSRPGSRRSRRARRRTSAHQRRGDLGRRRHRPLAGPVERRAHPRRALGGRRAAGPDRRAQHPRPRRALRRRALLLEPALRRADQLRRARARAGTPTEIVGSLDGRDALVVYRRGGRPQAVASIYRDVQSLEIQVAMERGDAGAVEAAVRAA